LENLKFIKILKAEKQKIVSFASGFTMPEFTITLGKHLEANIERGGSPEITDASIKIEDIYLNLQIALNKAEHVAVDQLGQHGANTLKAQKQTQTIKAGGSKYPQLENMFSKKSFGTRN
jgi:hypothetical protein